MMCSIRDVLTRAVETAPDKSAVIHNDTRTSYRDLLDRVRSLASVIRASGVNRGDRVAIFLPHSADEVAAVFAVWEAGAVAVLLNEALRSAQVGHILRDAEARLLLSNARKLNEVEPTGVRSVCVEALPSCPPAAILPPLAGSDLAMLLYTSGSTGLPRGVMLSHANLLAGARIVAGYLHLSASDVLAGVLPFSYDYGLNQLLTAVAVGATLVIPSSPLPGDLCAMIQRHQVTGVAGVPLLWQQLTHPRSPFLRETFPSLRYITNSGGAMPEGIVRSIRKAHPSVDIFLMYGLTEAFRSTFLSPAEVDSRPTSIGKAIPESRILVINERGEPCQPWEVGELVHSGPTVALGYWRQPRETAEVFRPDPVPPESGETTDVVVYSGDLVRKDEEGYLYFVGRRKELLKSRGIRVSPEEIEHVVHRSGSVIHAVAFAVPKDDVDSRIIVAVVPRTPEQFNDRELMSFCRREMPEYMRPEEIWTWERFPTTPSGKPDRVQIRAKYVQGRT